MDFGKDGLSEEECIAHTNNVYGHNIKNCNILDDPIMQSRFNDIAIMENAHPFAVMQNSIVTTWSDTPFTTLQLPYSSTPQRTGGCISASVAESGSGKNQVHGWGMKISRRVQSAMSEFMSNNNLMIPETEFNTKLVFNLNRKELSKLSVIDLTYDAGTYHQYLSQRINDPNYYILGGAKVQAAILDIVYHYGIGCFSNPEACAQINKLNSDKDGATDLLLQYTDWYIKGSKFSTDDLRIPDIIGNRATVSMSSTMGTYAKLYVGSGGNGMTGRAFGIFLNSDLGPEIRRQRRRAELNEDVLVDLEISRRFQTLRHHSFHQESDGTWKIRQHPLNFTLNNTISEITEYYSQQNELEEKYFHQINWPKNLLNENGNFIDSKLEPYDMYYSLQDTRSINGPQAVKSIQNRSVQLWANIAFSMKILRSQCDITDPRESINFGTTELFRNECIKAYRLYNLFSEFAKDTIRIYKKNSSISSLKKNAKEFNSYHKNPKDVISEARASLSDFIYSEIFLSSTKQISSVVLLKKARNKAEYTRYFEHNSLTFIIRGILDTLHDMKALKLVKQTYHPNAERNLNNDTGGHGGCRKWSAQYIKEEPRTLISVDTPLFTKFLFLLKSHKIKPMDYSILSNQWEDVERFIMDNNLMVELNVELSNKTRSLVDINSSSNSSFINLSDVPMDVNNNANDVPMDAMDGVQMDVSDNEYDSDIDIMSDTQEILDKLSNNCNDVSTKQQLFRKRLFQLSQSSVHGSVHGSVIPFMSQQSIISTASKSEAIEAQLREIKKREFAMKQREIELKEKEIEMKMKLLKQREMELEMRIKEKEIQKEQTMDIDEHEMRIKEKEIQKEQTMDIDETEEKREMTCFKFTGDDLTETCRLEDVIPRTSRRLVNLVSTKWPLLTALASQSEETVSNEIKNGLLKEDVRYEMNVLKEGVEMLNRMTK